MEIKLINLTKTLAQQVIQLTSFIIQSGSLTIAGASSAAAGKTTFVTDIAGLETPDSGEIWFEDQRVLLEKKINLSTRKARPWFLGFRILPLWPHDFP